MVLMPVRWPPCHRDHGITGGKTTAGPPRSQGQHTACPHDRFPRTLLSTGRAPALKEQSVALRLHGRGIRATARGLQSTPSTGMNPLKNKSRRSPRGPHRSATRCPLGPWTGCAGGRTKPQAMRGGLPWGSSPSPAGAGRPGRTALAPAWRRSVAAAQTRGLLPWKALLEPLGITRYATEPWGTDARHLDPEAPHAGQHHTQHSERTQLPLRTRITR